MKYNINPEVNLKKKVFEDVSKILEIRIKNY